MRDMRWDFPNVYRQARIMEGVAAVQRLLEAMRTVRQGDAHPSANLLRARERQAEWSSPGVFPVIKIGDLVSQHGKRIGGTLQ
jgi:hypothetical protein